MLNWIKEKINPSYKPNEKERLILDVVENMCNQNDTDIKMAPLSGRYYLVNKRKEFWIKIYDNGITITNHKFTFSHYAIQSFQDLIIRKVEAAIEKSRDEFEEAIFQNEVELLENIVTNIKNK
jgi:hypothetical protein